MNASRFSGQGAPPGPSLTQVRSTLSSPLYARTDVTDFSILATDLAQSPKRGEHWVLDNAVYHGFIATAIPPAGALLSPVSGLFLVEKQGLPVESLAQAAAAPGWDIRARGIPLPVVASIVPLPAGWAFAIFYNGMIGRTVPEGWTLRGIVNCNPATANPGPGAGSFGELLGVISREVAYGATGL